MAPTSAASQGGVLPRGYRGRLPRFVQPTQPQVKLTAITLFYNNLQKEYTIRDGQNRTVTEGSPTGPQTGEGTMATQTSNVVFHQGNWWHQKQDGKWLVHNGAEWRPQEDARLPVAKVRPANPPQTPPYPKAKQPPRWPLFPGHKLLDNRHG